jgi:L-fuconolactonase
VTSNDEAPIDPYLPVIDSHHHLFDGASDGSAFITKRRRFLIDDYVEYIGHQHNLIATIAVEAHSMYAVDGPEELRPINETEFLNGQAAMSRAGLYGPVRVAAGIIGNADLRRGPDVKAVLEAYLAVAPRRFRGIRQEGMWDADPSVLGGLSDKGPHLYLESKFRRGFAELAPLNLTFDAFVLAPQLADVTDLARNFPDTSIVLNHLGQPVGRGAHAGRLEHEFSDWRKNMTDIADCANVAVKMGGLGSFLVGSPTYRSDPPASSETLAAEWGPYVETTIQLFGADRVMFASNAPTDGAGLFSVVCNAYKRIVAACSDDERADVFARTAARVYRLDVPTARLQHVAHPSPKLPSTDC